jgi:hypothetical protein
MTHLDQYFFGYRRAEQERLQRQAWEPADEAQWLFDWVRVVEGARVIDRKNKRLRRRQPPGRSADPAA